ncbi:MAG: hypothetical protein GC192_02120 [Bacteroidetes bacterium]|nr:hypothetical protein [Bacteroidota bacterium]
MFITRLNKNSLQNSAKNILGWKTSRKVVVFAIDDYGNVRLASRYARSNMDKLGLKINSRFDAYDTLETRQDLDALYGALSSVKDKKGRHAIFTAYAVPCNIDFEAIVNNGHNGYVYELLPDTFRKLQDLDAINYEGAWNLWKDGIDKGLMAPQFHGREHFSLKIFEKKLATKDRELLCALENRSYTSINNLPNSRIGWTAAFAFDVKDDTEKFEYILKSGTDAFESVFGNRATSFTPPAHQFPSWLESVLPKYGIKYLDKPFYRKRHLGNGRFRTEFNSTKWDNKIGLHVLVRNVVFEPNDGNIDHIEKALQQIEAAFRWNKPAIISSHRVNFCGHINENNRKIGIQALRQLLKKIVSRWPDVEFMAAHELGQLIESTSHA